MQNPCGGLGWQTRPDGLIEVEGEGLIRYDPDSPQYEFLLQNARNWGSLFRSAARAYDVPLPWLLAIATMETGLWTDDPERQASIESPAGAVGIMQLMPFIAEAYGYSAAQRTDPVVNINVGAALISKLADEEDDQLPQIAARYNSGRLCSPGRNEWNLLADGNYPRKVIMWNNTVLLDGIGQSSVLLGAAVGAAGLYTAAVIAGIVAAPRVLKRLGVVR